MMSRPSIQRQRVRCGRSGFPVIFEAVGKTVGSFFNTALTAWCSWPLSSAHVHASNLKGAVTHTQDLSKLSPSALMASTFLSARTELWGDREARTTRKGQSADGMSADLLELSPASPYT